MPNDEKIIINCPECGNAMRIPDNKHIVFNCPKCGSRLEHDSSVKKVRTSPNRSNKKTHSSSVKNNNKDTEEESSLKDWLIEFAALVIALPIFFWVSALLPDPDWFWNIDRILLFGATYIIIYFICSLVEKLTIGILILAVAFMTYGSFAGNGFGFKNVFQGYVAMLVNTASHRKQQPTIPIFEVNRYFKEEQKKIRSKINYSDSTLRNFAIKNTLSYKDYEEILYNRKYNTIIQCFSLYHNISEHWHYVQDPKNFEYFATASETTSHLSGDCDDHAILLSACIKAIGGDVRLVRIEGHIYPELLIGGMSDLPHIQRIIGELFNTKDVHYRYDEERGEVWLNMDFMGYPGRSYAEGNPIYILDLRDL